ncbi:amino acid transporter [Aspergillus arachidicola]|uniref:Amino acid transporter n=1 Tax=Aspergillus arachidicola TaxID=656916 RepID=A0A2G7FFL5_9EURO|nr:amino acid transporter [Aspergillus arachidicola]
MLSSGQLELKDIGSAHSPRVEERNGCLDPDLSDDVKAGFTVNDQRDMQRMGKKQELRRNFRMASTIGFTTCVMGTWEILLTSNTPGLTAGGRPALFWSLVWAYCGQFFIVLSMAEMSSMAPTAGGQYHWVSEFAPRAYQKFLSYASGWLSTISWQSIVALDAYLAGTIVQGLISLNDDGYSPARWQGTLLVFAAAIGMSLFNIFGAKHLPLAEGIFVTCHFFAFIPVIVTLLVLAPKAKAEDVFTGFTDYGSGWPSVSWTVMVGQVSCMFVVLGSDSVAHMSEEIENASVIVPKSMIWAFLLNIPFAFGLLLTYLFCMPDVQSALDSPTGFPFIHVFREAVNNTAGATILVVIVLVLIVMITISSLASASRQTFAFARDNGLPFSNWLGEVNPRLHIPVNSIIVTCLFSMAMSLINIGSTVAFNAMLSLSTTALMATYLISIGCIIARRISCNPPLPPSRWTLGRFGMPVNILAMVYASWSFFWSFWPNAYDVNAENFNWASVLFVGLMGISTIVYWTYARKHYDGPVVKVEGRKFQ